MKLAENPIVIKVVTIASIVSFLTLAFLLLRKVMNKKEKNLDDNSPATESINWIDNNKLPLTKGDKRLITIADPKTRIINDKGKAIYAAINKEYEDGESTFDVINDEPVVAAVKELKTKGDVALFSAVFLLNRKKNFIDWARVGLGTEAYNEIIKHINSRPDYV